MSTFSGEDHSSLAQHYGRQFPSPSAFDEALSDWIRELAATDAYYVGLLTSNAPQIDLRLLAELEAQFDKISPVEADQLLHQECRQFLDSLKRVLTAARG